MASPAEEGEKPGISGGDPQGSESAPSYPLGNGWTATFDTSFGAYYYWHEGTGEVSWALPPGPLENVESSTGGEVSEQVEKKVRVPQEDSRQPKKKRKQDATPAPARPSSAVTPAMAASLAAPSNPIPFMPLDYAPFHPSANDPLGKLESLFATIDNQKSELDKLAEEGMVELKRKRADGLGNDNDGEKGGARTEFGVDRDKQEEPVQEFGGSSYEYGYGTSQYYPSSGYARAPYSQASDSIPEVPTFTAKFDRKNGRFVPQALATDARFVDPRAHFSDGQRAVRQMSVFFDYGKFSEESQLGRHKGPSNLTKKQLEEVKRRAKEKKEKKILAKWGKESEEPTE